MENKVTTDDLVKAYVETIDRLEPDITMVDRDAALASIAISLRRIANALEKDNQIKLNQIIVQDNE